MEITREAPPRLALYQNRALMTLMLGHFTVDMYAGPVIDDRGRDTAMSFYVTGGTVGVALGPLLGIVLFGLLGTRGTLLAFLPGACIAVWLLYELRGVAHRHPNVGNRAGAVAAA